MVGLVPVTVSKKAIAIVSSEILQHSLSLVPEDISLQGRRLLVIIHDLQSDLEMSLDEVVQLEVLVVLPEWIVKSLSHLEPTEEEEELDGHVDGIVEVQLAPLVLHLVTPSWTEWTGLSSPPFDIPDTTIVKRRLQYLIIWCQYYPLNIKINQIS